MKSGIIERKRTLWHTTPTARILADNFGQDMLALERQAAKSGERVYVDVGVDLFEPWDGPMGGKDMDAVPWCHQCRERTLSQDNVTCWCGVTLVRATIADVRGLVFTIIDRCPHLTFLLPTAHPERVREAWPETSKPPQKMVDQVWEGKQITCHPSHRPNIIPLAHITTQAEANVRVPELLRLADLCQCVGVDVVPRERIDLEHIPTNNRWAGKQENSIYNTLRGYTHSRRNKYVLNGIVEEKGTLSFIDTITEPKLGLVRVRGETGPDARPLNPDHVRALRDHAVGANVPFCFDGWGDWMPWAGPYWPGRGNLANGRDFGCFVKEYCFVKGFFDGAKPNMIRVGSEAAGRMLDGREWNEMPKGVMG